MLRPTRIPSKASWDARSNTNYWMSAELPADSNGIPIQQDLSSALLKRDFLVDSVSV